MKKPAEYFDTDFLDNKIEIGDKVILEEPKYRNFVIGTVVTKAPKSCQIEYKDFLGATQIARQYYGQIIKYPLFKEGKWIPAEYEQTGSHVLGTTMIIRNIPTKFRCSLCGRVEDREEPYCHCGARMDGDL